VNKIFGRYLTTRSYANVVINHDYGLAVLLRRGNGLDKGILHYQNRIAKLYSMRFEPGNVASVMDREVAAD
jgi:hypothetical protein